ncbi:hypothetical protein M413DRAFT_69374 [Hebeloma cylindrosporum]|uniref:F-box domain-containing protein n=1 Tax=Hebeloma cylindrosporum TaxID=76867 RepID=A0A0C3C380_HEBCY|nr:hypothetical protein M413DRAFT_69374 [Hebeloma cylindrosporum h7]
MAPSPDFPLPLELLTEIVKLLPTQDQRTLSLASQVTRIYSIPFAFRNLRYTEQVVSKILKIHQASQGVKDVIRFVSTLSSQRTLLKRNAINKEAVIFEFLKSLPNLQSFEFTQIYPLIRPAHIPQLINSLQHAPLNELVLATGNYAPVDGPPTTGPPGLTKISIKWNINDNPDEVGSSLAYLYELIRPSLSTLVQLSVNYSPDPETHRDHFDLKFLEPARETLRVLDYALQPDESVLELIPEILPHLKKLSIKWLNIPSGQSVLWKVRSQLKVHSALTSRIL